MKLKIDKEFSKLIQPLQKQEFKALSESIIDEGCRDAIIAWNDTIIDGHNRYKVCTENDIEFSVLYMDFDSRDDAMMWMINNQQGRRNLPKVNRCKLALKKQNIVAARLKKRQIRKPVNSVPQKSAEQNDSLETRKELAKEAGVSHDTLGKVENVEKTGIEPLKEIYSKTDSDVSVNMADKVAKLEEEDQEKFVEKVEEGVKPTHAYAEILTKNQPERREPKQAGNFERLSKVCLEFTEGLQLFAEGTLAPETKYEAIYAKAVLDAAPNIIMQLVRLNVDVEWCIRVARGDNNATIEQRTQGERLPSDEIIDVVAD